MSYTKPLPRIDTTNKGFWDAAKENRLVVQQCDDCTHTFYPPSHVCPTCLSSNLSWRQCSGRGTLEGWIDMHRAYWDGFRDDLPYRVCLVKLEEGPLLVSNLVGDNENPKFRQPVKVVFEPITDEFTLPKWVLA